MNINETNKNNKKLTISMSVQQHREIKLAAASRGITMKEFIEKSLIEYGKFLKKNNL